jgi:hypothetical protein
MANRGQDTPVAVARISSSHLRASLLRQTAAPAAAVVVVAVAVAAVVVVVVVAAAADVGMIAAATFHCLAEAENQLAVVVAGVDVGPAEWGGLEESCWGRESIR